MFVDGGLLNFLQCPSCHGEYKFYNVETSLEIFEGSGVLVCNRCGRSIIVIKGIPIFHEFFKDASSAMNFLSLIYDRDKSTSPFLHSIMHRPMEHIDFLELLDFLHREKIDIIFKRFGTPYISLKRFKIEKYQKICRFLTDEPIETLLDLGCGFGCSTIPFAESGKAEYCVGLDSNFFFLLLFDKYCQENNLQNIGLILFNVENLPFPLKKSRFDVVIGISFFNHFISSKNKDTLYSFIKELTRITRNGGRIFIDAVPNRLHPFPGEVNMPGLLKRKSLEKATKFFLSCVPFKWFPRSISMSVLWRLYRLYCFLIGNKVESYNTFLDYVSSIIPEANVQFLPLSPFYYKKLLNSFTEVRIMPQNEFYKELILKEWKARDFFKSVYLVLYAKR